MSLFIETKINNNLANMTKKEIVISEWVLLHKPDFLNTSITLLSSKIKTSPSSINRWCYKLGFEGYKDFISSVKNQKNFHDKYKYTINITSKDIMYSIASTESLINYDELEIVANKIMKNKEVIFYGESFTHLQASYFSRMFKKINIRTSIINVASDLAIIMPSKKAIHIFVSMSGRNKNIKQAYEKLTNRDEKSFIVSIAANKKTNLTDKVNVELHGSHYQTIKIDNYELPIAAKATTEYILTQLFIAVYNKDKEKHSELIKLIAKEKTQL